MRGEFVLYHDGQFWVGVLTLSEAGRTRSARVVFGAEPSDAQLYDHLLRHGDELLRAAEAAPWVPAWTARPPSPNPKRLARQAAKAAREVGVSTASQEALRLAQEACRRQRQGRAREQREAEAEHKRELRRAKAKAKHRGR